MNLGKVMYILGTWTDGQCGVNTTYVETLMDYNYTIIHVVC